MVRLTKQQEKEVTQKIYDAYAKLVKEYGGKDVSDFKAVGVFLVFNENGKHGKCTVMGDICPIDVITALARLSNESTDKKAQINDISII